MSPWAKLGWQHWRLKHLDHLKTHGVLRICCWIMRAFKKDRTQIHFWISCWLKSRLTHKHGYRLNSCSHREQGLWEEPFCVTYQSSKLYYSTAGGGYGLKQWALYHYIANLGDSTAEADDWLKMTVQWWWFQTHCSEIWAHLKRVRPCPFFWTGGWSPKRLFLCGSAALVPCLPDLNA